MISVGLFNLFYRFSVYFADKSPLFFGNRSNLHYFCGQIHKVIYMFSGIVEETAKVVAIRQDKENVHFTLKCSFVDELSIDQSVAHNGVCLTVVCIENGCYTVPAMRETLERSNLGLLCVGDEVNVERSMQMNGRLDGHIVQGHVDQTAVCTQVEDQQGSFQFTFQYETSSDMVRRGYFTVDKGSVTVNGVNYNVELENAPAAVAAAPAAPSLPPEDIDDPNHPGQTIQRLVLDRKLMMYGPRHLCYSIRLSDDGDPVNTNTLLGAHSEDQEVSDYVPAMSKPVQVDNADQYAGLVGCLIRYYNS